MKQKKEKKEKTNKIMFLVPLNFSGQTEEQVLAFMTKATVWLMANLRYDWHWYKYAIASVDNDEYEPVAEDYNFIDYNEYGEADYCVLEGVYLPSMDDVVVFKLKFGV